MYFGKKLIPNAFDINDLAISQDSKMVEWVSKLLSDLTSLSASSLNSPRGAEMLCYSAFGLDLIALKYLLYEIGVEPNLQISDGANSLHCLAQVSYSC
jgi:hypothetical protein